MRLAQARRPEKYHILPIFQETHSDQFVDLVFAYRGLEGKVKVIRGLLNGEAGHLDLLLIGSFSLEFRFLGKDMIQCIHNIEIFAASSRQSSRISRVFSILRLSRFSRSLFIANSLIQRVVISG